MAAQAPTRAGRGNCARGRTIPRHARAQRGRARRPGGVGRVKPGGGDGVARAEGTATGGKVRAVPPVSLACAQTGGRAEGNARERKGRQSPPPGKRGRRTVPPAPPACAQRGGGRAGEAGGETGGGGGAQPGQRGLSANGK